MKKLNIGLFCNTVIGEEYLKTISSMEQFQLSGFAGNINQKFLEKQKVPYFANEDLLLDEVDAVLIVMDRARQFELAKKTIKNLKHLLIEKPFTSNIDEAETLLSMQREADVKIQLGGGLRLNKSFLEANPLQYKPQFIETRNYKEAGADVSVVLDLMLNDIDIILHLVKSEVRKISANGVCLVNDTPDIINARIEFGNGCVASLTANRIAKNNLHCTTLFQRGAPVVIDFLNSNNIDQPESAYKIATQGQATEKIIYDEGDTKLSDTITNELSAFYESIVKNSPPLVPLYDGCRALKLAYQILEKIQVVSGQ